MGPSCKKSSSVKYISRLTFAVIALLILNCSKNARHSPERNYYFEIKTHQEGAYYNELKAFLMKEIPQRKYTITNGSGRVWPYYASFEIDEQIAVDSLMPPHWYVHKMIAKDSNVILQNEDHLVRIDMMLDPDTILNYQVEIYEMDSIELVLTASSGIHYVDSTLISSRSPHTVEVPTREPLHDYLLKSIIRYSFK